MLCSISTPKSNSSWLDRLRSSKGFSISPDLENFDQFLSSNPNPNPNPSPSPTPIPKTSRKPPIDNDCNLFDLMSTVLSDLFVMGGSSRKTPNPQKSCRKQPNPRNCNGAGPLAGGKREVSPSSVNNSAAAAAAAAEGRKRKLKARKMRGSEGVKDPDLLGFSRTEVTVIDTSLSPDWKAARVLYRKGLVWKVREKKMVRVGWKKRRRVGLAEKPESWKERKGNDAGLQIDQLALLDKGCTQTDKIEDSEDTDDQIIVPRRQKFSTSPWAPATKNSILHLKIIREKNGAAGPSQIFKRKC